MTTCSLDVLIQAVRDAVLSANEIVRTRRQAMLETTPQTGERVLQVQIPQGPAPDASCSSIALPLHLFRDQRIPHIGMLSIEFDCSLHFRKGQASPQLLLRIGKPRFTWLLRRRLHHIRIAYLSANAWEPLIDIDGRRLAMPLVAQAEG